MKKRLLLVATIALSGCTDYSEETTAVKAFCESTKDSNSCFASASVYASAHALRHFGYPALKSGKNKHCENMPGLDALACTKEAFGDNSTLGLLAKMQTQYAKQSSGLESEKAKPVPASEPIPSEVASRKGSAFATMQGNEFVYTLTRLGAKDAPNVFEMMMATTPTGTIRRPQVPDDPIYINANIVTEEGDSKQYAKNTTLMIGTTKVFSASVDNEGYEISSLSALDGQPELLLVEVYAGGNSCSSHQQILVVRDSTLYSFSPPFGTCNATWWNDEKRDVTYLVYAADEYNPMEIISIRRTAR